MKFKSLLLFLSFSGSLLLPCSADFATPFSSSMATANSESPTPSTAETTENSESPTPSTSEMTENSESSTTENSESPTPSTSGTTTSTESSTLSIIVTTENSESSTALTSERTTTTGASITDNSQISTSSTSVTTTDSETTTTTGSSKWIDVGSNVLYTIEDTPVSWFEAVWNCENKGINSRLASFESALYKYRLGPYLERSAYWIGLYRGKSDQFQRIGTIQSGFFDWAPGEPNNGHGSKEDCVEYRSSSRKWNDGICDLRRPYICASDKVNPEPVQESVTGRDDSDNVQTEASLTIKSTSAPVQKLVTGRDDSDNVQSESSLTIKEIANDCHAIVTALSFLSVLVFFVFLVTIVVRRLPLPPKTNSSSF